MKQDNIKAMDIDTERLRNAISNLSGAFVWSGTKEGHKYWNNISNGLSEIEMASKNICPHCGKKMDR